MGIETLQPERAHIRSLKTLRRSDLDQTAVPRELPETLRTGLVQLSDAALVAASLNGDTAAYGELINRHQDSVNTLARTMVRDYQHAEDLAQETFLKAYHFLNDLQEAEKFGGWILTILRHTALDFLRSKKEGVSLETLQEDGFEPEDGTRLDPQVAAIETHEDELRVISALQTLREDYREIIILKHVERLSYKEIAERTNMTVSGVGEKLSRVRALLKQRLEKKPVKGAARRSELPIVGHIQRSEGD